MTLPKAWASEARRKATTQCKEAVKKKQRTQTMQAFVAAAASPTLASPLTRGGLPAAGLPAATPVPVVGTPAGDLGATIAAAAH